MTDGVTNVGAFLSADYLDLCIRELFMRLCPAAHLLFCHLPGLPEGVRAVHEALMKDFLPTAQIIQPQEDR